MLDSVSVVHSAWPNHCMLAHRALWPACWGLVPSLWQGGHSPSLKTPLGVEAWRSSQNSGTLDRQIGVDDPVSPTWEKGGHEDHAHTVFFTSKGSYSKTTFLRD